LARSPGAIEKGLALEVAIELIGKLHTHILEDVAKELFA
jgi:hypothetical protein